MNEILRQFYASFYPLFDQGMIGISPGPDFLFYEQYDFSGLKKHRDKATGLIGLWQSDKEIPIGQYSCAAGLTMTIDFGDSAMKTGVLAFCNSLVDQDRLHHY